MLNMVSKNKENLNHKLQPVISTARFNNGIICLILILPLVLLVPNLAGICSWGAVRPLYCVSFVIILQCLGLVGFYFHKTYKYWLDAGVPGPRPSFLVGHTLRRLGITMHILEFYDDLYYNFNGKDFCGIFEFLKPSLLIGNLELIRNITNKDFDHFANRRVFPLTKVNPIANEMLSNATGENWKKIRTSISPVFTSHKLKQLYPLICQQGDEFVRLLGKTSQNNKEFEMRKLCEQFTMDTIASCAFGIECKAMDSDRTTFTEMAAKIFVLSPIRALKIIVLLTAPFLAHWIQVIGVDFTSEEFHFFHKVVSRTIQVRDQNGIRRGDFLDLMKDTKKLSETTITAQAILFLLAGQNNIASALSFTLHLLAVNQDVQDCLRTEIVNCFNPGSRDIDHEELHKLPLLDCVIKESLRLYPSDPNLERLCTKDYQLPGTNVMVRKGQLITIPIWSIHHDPDYWPDPDSFKPERFFHPDTFDINAFLPFGSGPRQCIGLKFVYLVAKVGLSKIIRNYKIIPSARTVHPPPLSPRSFLSTQPLNGLPLSLEPLLN